MREQTVYLLTRSTHLKLQAGNFMQSVNIASQAQAGESAVFQGVLQEPAEFSNIRLYNRYIPIAQVTQLSTLLLNQVHPYPQMEKTFEKPQCSPRLRFEVEFL